MDDRARDRFDAILEEILASLPEPIAELLEEVPLVVDDEPTRELAISLANEWGEPTDDHTISEFIASLCGLHSGPMLTERSVEMPTEIPERIQIFRRGVISIAGGDNVTDDQLAEEIEITLLHEIGHHFGLDEDDLERLGYA